MGLPADTQIRENASKCMLDNVSSAEAIFSIQLIGKADDNKKTIELKRQLCFDVPAYHVKSSSFQEIFQYLNAHHKRTRYPDIPPKRHISRHSYMWWQVEQKSALVRITTRIACLY